MNENPRNKCGVFYLGNPFPIADQKDRKKLCIMEKCIRNSLLGACNSKCTSSVEKYLLRYLHEPGKIANYFCAQHPRL